MVTRTASLTALPLTKVKPRQGEATMRFEKACGAWYPACTAHGAMNRVAADMDWWRCPTCNIGVEWNRK